MSDRATSRPSLLEQLKRRRVLRVVVMSLGAAFVVGCTAGSSPPAEPRLEGPFLPTVLEPVPERRTEDVILRRGTVSISGTLEWPESKAPVPAVLLVQGSAAFTRGNMGLFDTLAARLSAAGFASLRVDDRGVGGSGGVKHDLTADDLAEDVAALHAYLLSRPAIDRRRVGILGHSFGGALAPLVANRSHQVAFVVMLAGYAVPGERLMTEARRRTERSRGTEPSEIARILALQRLMFDAARSGGPWEPVEREHRELRRIEFERMDAAARARHADLDAYIAGTPDQAVFDLARTPWFASFLDLDPEPILRALEVPVLAIFGGRDTAVPPQLNVEPMRDALAGNARASVRVVPDADHFFRVSGRTAEGLPSTLTDWLKRTTGGS